MKHDFVVGAYNTGGHCVLVIMAMKWNVVWYLDSAQTWLTRKFKDVQQVMNWVYSVHMEKKMKTMKTKSKTKPKLMHKPEFPCAQQPSGSMLCGFYVALNMLDLLGDLSIMKKASDYKPTKKVDKAALMMVQGMLCEFILKKIIDPKGDFYDSPAGAA
ncbi:unnamed protein product [Urochloa humidicola]